MATVLGKEINIISANLNNYGNAGTFESDRSTWGFSDVSAYWAATRSSTWKFNGSWSCKSAVTGTKTPTKTLLIPANFNAVQGKKYLIEIVCHIEAGGNPYDLVGSLRLFYEDIGWTFVTHSTAQLSSAVNSTVVIQMMVERTGADLNNSKFYIGIDDVTQTDGAADDIYFDDFYIREYEDVVATCTLAIDSGNTTITDETTAGANDGTIDVATTGGTAPLEYSKDNVNWQSSSQFTGLAPGIYTIYVRDSAATPCTAQQVFSVNAAAISFDFTVAITDESVTGAADGQIDITVTGSGGPFQYSKDGGSSYQSSNIFSNLAPGDYPVVVKDAGGNTKSQIVTVSTGIVVFDSVYFSKNHIPYLRYSSINYSNNNYRVMIDVRVEDVANSGSFVSKMKAAMPPAISAENQEIKFNLRPAFRGVLSATPPNLNDTEILKLTDRAKLYKVYYGDIYDQLEEPAAWAQSSTYLVILGGVSKFKYPTINFFYNYLPNNKKFMTWAPNNKDVDANQEDYLQFWVYQLSFTSVKLMLKVYYDDATDQTATIKTQAVTYGDLLQLPAGPLNLGAAGIDPTKNMSKYDVWLTDQDDNVISEVRTYKLTPFKHPRTRYYLFLNSLGAYEVLRTYGFREEKSTINRVVSEKLLPIGYEPLDGQFDSGEASKQNSYKVSSGYLSKEWLKYMQDIGLSRKVYDITDGDRVPIINMTKNVIVEQNKDNKRFVRFEFMKAYADQSYTPTDV